MTPTTQRYVAEVAAVVRRTTAVLTEDERDVFVDALERIVEDEHDNIAVRDLDATVTLIPDTEPQEPLA